MPTLNQGKSRLLSIMVQISNPNISGRFDKSHSKNHINTYATVFRNRKTEMAKLLRKLCAISDDMSLSIQFMSRLFHQLFKTL